jgi:hypothetical protein
MVSVFAPSQKIQHKNGSVGTAYAVVPSPYPNEEAEGVQRLMVWTEIPGAGGTFFGWDWWKLDECIPLPDANVPQGALAVIVNRNGQEETALVMASGYDEIAVMLGDGELIWIALSTVISVTTACVPLTNRLDKLA